MKRLALAAAVLVLAAGPVWAGQAVCRDYTQAIKEDRSLFDGYIFGYVSAKLEAHRGAEIDETTMKVKRLVDGYCQKKPTDRVANVVAAFTDIAITVLK